MDLTPRQAEILDFLRRHRDEQGVPPTRAEIVAAFGFRSPTAAEDHLRALERKGVIELRPGASRGIRLLERADEYLSEAVQLARREAANEASLPLVGRVAAGAPILSDPNVETRIPLAGDFFRPRAHFLLRVQGESMRDAGILDGDLLAVHQTPEARSGQTVVARLEDEITVKTLRLKGGIAELLPANPDFSPIVVDLSRESLVIEGLAVGLIRGGFGSPLVR